MLNVRYSHMAIRSKSTRESPDISKAGVRSLLENLRRRGELVAVRLALENAQVVAPASIVSKRYNIPISTLHGWKRDGRAIAFRLPAAKRDLFPLAQFSDGEVAPWARSIVAFLGNGMPAFHFLMVGRRSQTGASYSRRVLEFSRTAAAEIEAGLRLIEIE
jgi:hypothetical protein